MEFDFDAIEEEDSPFPEVRASVSNIDDPEMPCLTLRMWFIGLLLIMVTGCVASALSNCRGLTPHCLDRLLRSCTLLHIAL